LECFISIKCSSSSKFTYGIQHGACTCYSHLCYSSTRRMLHLSSICHIRTTVHSSSYRIKIFL